MEIGDGVCYLSCVYKYVEYFNRCKSVGLSDFEIEKNLKYLEKYYKRDIKKYKPKSLFGKGIYENIHTFFNYWCSNN